MPEKSKSKVFVLMPFSANFDDIYEFGIKYSCNTFDLICERVDEQIFSENILQRVYNQISIADIIIADLTGKNANVFYEVGFAHANEKTVILLTQNEDDIPFDLKHFPHIIYNGKIKKLKDSLIKKLEYFINHPTDDRIKKNDKIIADYENKLKFLEQENKITKEEAQKYFIETIQNNAVIKKMESLFKELTNRMESDIKENRDNKGLLSNEAVQETINHLIGPNDENSSKVNEENVKRNNTDTEYLVTDTLAQIYITQGNYNKAIFAYKKLLLKYPDKEVYFKKQIEQLEKRLR